MEDRFGLVGWPIPDSSPTVNHRLDAGQESPPAKNWHPYHRATPPTIWAYCLVLLPVENRTQSQLWLSFGRQSVHCSALHCMDCLTALAISVCPAASEYSISPKHKWKHSSYKWRTVLTTDRCCFYVLNSAEMSQTLWLYTLWFAIARTYWLSAESAMGYKLIRNYGK